MLDEKECKMLALIRTDGKIRATPRNLRTIASLYRKGFLPLPQGERDTREARGYWASRFEGMADDLQRSGAVLFVALLSYAIGLLLVLGYYLL